MKYVFPGPQRLRTLLLYLVAASVGLSVCPVQQSTTGTPKMTHMKMQDMKLQDVKYSVNRDYITL